jgi:hypothetical protein
MPAEGRDGASLVIRGALEVAAQQVARPSREVASASPLQLLAAVLRLSRRRSSLPR